jgi:hypothetical protein
VVVMVVMVVAMVVVVITHAPRFCVPIKATPVTHIAD